jgi:hypothetical protein
LVLPSIIPTFCQGWMMNHKGLTASISLRVKAWKKEPLVLRLKSFPKIAFSMWVKTW